MTTSTSRFRWRRFAYIPGERWAESRREQRELRAGLGPGRVVVEPEGE
jgi:hypothetical protein